MIGWIKRNADPSLAGLLALAVVFAGGCSSLGTELKVDTGAGDAASGSSERVEGPIEFRVGDRPTPVLPEGMTAIVVPVETRQVTPSYYPAPLMPQHEGITAFDLPKPAKPSPTGRGRGMPAVGSSAVLSSASAAATEVYGAETAAITAEEPAPFAPPTTVFDSTTFDDNSSLSGSLFIPPDPHAAAGMTHVVNVVNTTIRYHSKGGATTFHAGLASFFASLGPLTATFDPKVLYDQFEDRFVVVTLEQLDTAFGDLVDASFIFVAVSDDGDPNGTWYFASIPVVITPASCGVPSWADYPGFAVDEEAIYITNNLFGFFSFGAPFCGTRLWIIDKGAVGGFYAGLTASVTPPLDLYAGGGIATTTQPAHVYCTPGATCPSPDGTYLVSYSGLSGGGDEFLQIVRVDNPLTTPAFTQEFLNIGDKEPLTAGLPSAPQSGSTFPIATNDRRALDAVWRDDNSLWMTMTIDPNAATAPNDVGEATAAWAELDTTTGGATTLDQFGIVSGDTCGAPPAPGCGIAANTHTFFPAIAVNSNGDVAVGFSASAGSIFPGSYYATRDASDPAGFLGPAQTVRAGLDTYERTFDSSAPCSNSSSRWGDYTGMALDPTTECFWAYNQHAIARGTPTTGVCGSLTPAGSENGRWGTAYQNFCGDCPTVRELDTWSITTSETVKASDTIEYTDVTIGTGGSLTASAPNHIFADGFESGDLQVWSTGCP